MNDEFTADEMTMMNYEIKITWCAYDVFTLDGGENNLRGQDCIDILNKVEAKHDCEQGVNWDVIQFWIDEHVAERDSVENLFKDLSVQLFTTEATKDYAEVTDLTLRLCSAIEAVDGEPEELWSLGEGGECTLSDFIIGAYWHFTDWHSGQASTGYQALSALGSLFTPNMSTLEEGTPEHYAYKMFEELAGK